MLRGRSGSLEIDLKNPAGAEVLLRMVEGADVLIEGYRPGVTERLGVGPDVCLERNERLVYGRVTGWGQTGPRATEAGHDIDYLAVAGDLHMFGPGDAPPPPPLNLVADFGGGGMLLVAGVLAALVERQGSGRGQVIDAAMVDGSALLATMFHEWIDTGLASTDRQSNLLDGGAPFYRCYQTADGRFLAVGALEPRFYEEFVTGLGLDGEILPDQYDRSGWPELERRFAEEIARRSRDDWVAVFAGADACVAPVLSPVEAPRDPHLRERASCVDGGGVTQPAPAPRLSRTPGKAWSSTTEPVAGVLGSFGLTIEEVAALVGQRVVGPGPTNSPAARHA